MSLGMRQACRLGSSDATTSSAEVQWSKCVKHLSSIARFVDMGSPLRSDALARGHSRSMGHFANIWGDEVCIRSTVARDAGTLLQERPVFRTCLQSSLPQLYSSGTLDMSSIWSHPKCAWVNGAETARHYGKCANFGSFEWHVSDRSCFCATTAVSRPVVKPILIAALLWKFLRNS